MGDDGGRTSEQIREHYEIEKELAAKLRGASKEERRRLYTAVYDELMERVPHHPLVLAKRSARDSAKRVEFELGLLRRFLTEESVFLEIGPGDCAVARAVAQIVGRVYAVDVSSQPRATSRIRRTWNLSFPTGPVFRCLRIPWTSLTAIS